MTAEHLCRIFNCDKVHKNQCCNYCKYHISCKNRCFNKHKLCGQFKEPKLDTPK